MDYGSGWIINGYFKLVHVINLEQYEKALENLEEIMKQDINSTPMRSIMEFHLNMTKLRLCELENNHERRPRSINWIGSAWKWIAGSPDAIDWDNILQRQNKIVANNNNQYVINEQIFNISQAAIVKLNEVVSFTNSINKRIDSENMETVISSKILVLKEQISEIVRASQMAKTGIVNTNLLDQLEIEKIISEEESLPYQNIIEAVEYAKPSIYTNGTLLLYVISVPKVAAQKYRVILARATSLKGKQVNLKHHKLMISEDETYGITGDCFHIRNITICEADKLKKLPEDGCDARLLKGGNADCHFITNMEETVELLNDNTIFLTNFNGTVKNEKEERTINGTFIIQLKNERLKIGNQTFSSKDATTIQTLPSIFTNVTNKGIKLNLEYIHTSNLKNIERIKKLGEVFNISTVIEAIILIILACTCYKIWRKITTAITIPKTDEAKKNSTNLRDADI